MRMSSVRLGGQRRGEVQQFNIRLLRDSGEVLVKLDDFCVRAPRGSMQGREGVGTVEGLG
jgi:hypothetical protein